MRTAPLQQLQLQRDAPRASGGSGLRTHAGGGRGRDERSES